MSVPCVLAAESVSVTFPERGDYSFWICSPAGQVTTTPITVRDRETVDLPVKANPGDVLDVLDLSTGQVAVMPLAVDNFGHASAVDLLNSDFTDVPRVSGDSRPILLGHSTDSSPATPASTAPGDAWGGVVLAFLFGAGLSGVLGWYTVRFTRRSVYATLLPETQEGERTRESTRARPAVVGGEREETVDPAHAPVRVTRLGERVGRNRRRRDVAYLVGTQGIVSGSRFALDSARITIGRDDENDIAVAENTISRHHATLIRIDGGLYSVVDEESANGIFVNGMRTQRAILQPGDEIKIGDCFFRFESN